MSIIQLNPGRGIMPILTAPLAPLVGLKHSTAIAAPVQTKGPVIETTTAENAIIGRFLAFAMDDVRYQLEMTAKDRNVTKRDFEAGREAAVLISTYLAGLIAELERMSANPAPEATQ